MAECCLHLCEGDKPELELEDLVEDKRSYPLTGAEFRSFLKSQYVDENFDFVVDVFKYKQMVENISMDGPQISVSTTVDFNTGVEASPLVMDKVAPKTLAEASIILKDTYIENHAVREVNIPHTLKTKTIAMVKEQKDLPVAFEDAEDEIKKLLRAGLYVDKFVQRATQNIDTTERVRRLFMSAATLVITAALAAWPLIFDYPRLWQLLSVVMFFGFASTVLSVYFGI